MLGGSALLRSNGLTQFGARHLVSRVGGDPFSNIGETEEAVQLPIALWCANSIHTHLMLLKPTSWAQCYCRQVQYYHIHL